MPANGSPGGRISTADTVAGFLAAFALLGGLLGLVWYPGRVGTAALLVALIAAGLATAQRRLAAGALAFATVCWLAGMVIAVVSDRPVF
ncbi:MAG: hypothetical protein ICV74_07355 [Thermoleophilia bacterium]|nr:hypothetical protein [Thermoleophilia bacterium]